MPNDARFDRLKQFMECEEGKHFLEGIRNYLKGQTIVEVEFFPKEDGIVTTLLLKDGEYFEYEEKELTLETLSEQFSGLFRELSHEIRKEE